MYHMELSDGDYYAYYSSGQRQRKLYNSRIIYSITSSLRQLREYNPSISLSSPSPSASSSVLLKHTVIIHSISYTLVTFFRSIIWLSNNNSVNCFYRNILVLSRQGRRLFQQLCSNQQNDHYHAGMSCLLKLSWPSSLYHNVFLIL